MRIKLIKENYLGATLHSKLTGFIQLELADCDYATACKIADSVCNNLQMYDGIELPNATTFEKTFVPDAVMESV